MHTIRLKSAAILGAGLIVGGWECGGSRSKGPNPSGIFREAAVVCAHPLAAAVGKLVLAAGGNAVDAAVAVHFALAVVYPNAGNIGGGGFALVRTGPHQVYCLDFRETAPQAAHENMFLNREGKPIPELSTGTVLAAGVPGSVAGMAELHQRFGCLPWPLLLKPAIQLARRGFPLTDRQAKELNENAPLFQERNPRCCYLSHPKGGAWQAGDTLRQPELARALECIAERGAPCFYSGWIADSLEAFMRSRGGLITKADLAQYRPRWRKPLSLEVGPYRVWAPPLPSAGGLSIFQMIRLANLLGLRSDSLHSPEFLRIYCKLSQLAFEDRYRYAGDPDYVHVLEESILDSAYLLRRYKEVRVGRFLPAEFIKCQETSEHTTHFSVVDGEGWAVSLTTTINDSYGSRILVCGAGFLLNNEMDDFAVAPGAANLFGLPGSPRNRIGPRRRMVSSMSPIIVEKEGQPVLVLGTPGGTTIVSTLVLALYHTLIQGRPLKEFQKVPRFHYQGSPHVLWVEAGGFKPELLRILNQENIPVRERSPIGRLDGLEYRDGYWYGVPDPRGDDAAEGF
ncbi:MAG: gamma-glutamyltransferase [Flavobacteriales bacterium]|nr:gamma-glutamyltransferase [Flavobacteriales bacterium]MCX7768633.1 gamma-glutamyltransferase [Flavobacteriales bacterium]MDW8409714.1 gamma-glutamyltransferase [Flavobacteriales bacterium]